MRARLAIGAVGVVVALYGALLLLTRQDPGQWLEVLAQSALRSTRHRSA